MAPVRPAAVTPSTPVTIPINSSDADPADLADEQALKQWTTQLPSPPYFSLFPVPTYYPLRDRWWLTHFELGGAETISMKLQRIALRKHHQHSHDSQALRDSSTHRSQRGIAESDVEQ